MLNVNWKRVGNELAKRQDRAMRLAMRIKEGMGEAFKDRTALDSATPEQLRNYIRNLDGMLTNYGWGTLGERHAIHTRVMGRNR